MGMYTKLHLEVALKKETPAEVIKTLEFMLDPFKEPPEEAPFHSARWRYMLQNCSFYHYPFSHSNLDSVSHSCDKYLFVDCDFKDYNSELEAFLNFLSPWVDNNRVYDGYYRYEEEPFPTFFKFVGDTYEILNTGEH